MDTFVDIYVFHTPRQAEFELPRVLRPRSLMVIHDPYNRRIADTHLIGRRVRFAYLLSELGLEAHMMLTQRLSHRDAKIMRPDDDGFLSPAHAALRAMELLPTGGRSDRSLWVELTAFAGSAAQ